MQAGVLFHYRQQSVVERPVVPEFSDAPKPAAVSEKTAQSARLSAEIVRGGIVPHHLMVKDQLSSYFKDLPRTDYETVVIIGPNHFNRGGKMATSDVDWPTAAGDLEADKGSIAKTGLDIQNEAMVKEHSIGNLASFIKEAIPKAKLLPIMLRADTSPDEVEELVGRLIEATAGKRILVLASVDFSHYQPVAAADFHDEASRAAIENLDFARIYKLEIDSPPSIYALLKYLSVIGAGKSQLKFSTNSGRLAPATADNTTSHNFYYFYDGQPKKVKFFSGLFFGDLMIDRHVGERIKKVGVNGLADTIAGQERRFVSGMDIVMANLEGAVTDSGAHYPPVNGNDFAFLPATVGQFKERGFNFFNIANNHLTDQGKKGVTETSNNLSELGYGFSGCGDRQVGDCSGAVKKIGDTKVALLGFSMVYGDFDLDSAKSKVIEAKKQNDFVVVNVHWGSEYTHQFSRKQQAVGRALIDAGADVIIGHHPHVTQGIEAYKGKLIFYSLGNFIFDQYFSRDTQESLAVGLVMEKGTTTARIFPLKQKRSVPELMKGKEKEDFLVKVSEWSVADSSLEQKIRSGVLMFSE